MAKKDSVSKVHLSSFDDLFQTDESREDLKRERLMDIPISQIREFPEQREKSPFRDSRISKAIPKAIPKEQQCEFVIKAIEHYTLFLQRSRNRDRGAR